MRYRLIQVERLPNGKVKLAFVPAKSAIEVVFDARRIRRLRKQRKFHKVLKRAIKKMIAKKPIEVMKDIKSQNLSSGGRNAGRAPRTKI